jgi:hypothetical protein
MTSHYFAKGAALEESCKRNSDSAWILAAGEDATYEFDRIANLIDAVAGGLGAACSSHSTTL